MINFCAKLKVDDSVYKKLKFNNPNEIVEATRYFIEEKASNLLPDDEFTMYAGSSQGIDKVFFKHRNKEVISISLEPKSAIGEIYYFFLEYALKAAGKTKPCHSKEVFLKRLREIILEKRN